MRSSLGRITLRGAKRLASGPTIAPAPAVGSLPIRRELCTSSAVSPETRKPGDLPTKDGEHVSTVMDTSSEAPEPVVEVLTDGAGLSSVEPVVAVPSSEHEVPAEEGDVVVRDALVEDAPRTESSTTELFDTLKTMLDRNATRSALWNYGAALRVEGAPAVDMKVMRLILPVMGRNSWSEASERTLVLAGERGYMLGTSMFNCGLHAMAKSGDTDAISAVLDRMWAMTTDSNPNASSYNYLIAAHIYRGNVDDAFDVLNHMKKHLIYPTFATYHALITGCLRRRDPRRAYQTLLAVEKQRFDISAMTIAQVLVASAQNDDYDHVLHLLAKLEDALPRYTSELHRIAEFRGLYRLKTSERTTKTQRDQMRGDPKLELGAISSVLHCAFRGGRADIASRVWLLLEEIYPDYQPPLPFWYCLIGAHAGAGDFATAIDIVGVMREKGLQICMRDLDLALIRPLAYDVSAIDEQYFRLCDRATGKEAALGEQPSTSVSPVEPDVGGMDGEVKDEDPAAKDLSDLAPAADSATGESTEAANDSENIIAASEAKRPSLSDALLRPSETELKGSSVLQFSPKTVGIDELNCIISACSTSQDLDRAFQTYDEAKSRFNLVRNIDTYNALLEGCVQTRRLSGGLRVLEEIETVGLPISGYTVHLGSRLMLRGGRNDDVITLLRKSQEDGKNILLQTFQMVLKHFTRMENTAPAVQVLEIAESAGYNFRSLTGRFDLEGVKKLHLAAYGKELPMPVREKKEGRERKGYPGAAGEVKEVPTADDSVVEKDVQGETGEELGEDAKQ